MAVVGTAQVLIVPSFKGMERSIKSGLLKPLQESAARGADPGLALGNRVIGGFGKALKFGAGSIIAASALTVGTALTKGFGRLQALENAEATLSGLGHTAKGVETIMDDALASVKGTAFGMGEAATTAASAVAAGVKPGKDLQRTLTLVGDAATIAQTDMASMGSIINKVATSDMMQMDVANQLMDAGIPILQMVADEMGVTAVEARKLASDGKISFETFQNALENGVGGAAQKSGDTLQGAFANTTAALGRIGASFLDPLYEAAGGLLRWAMEALGPVEEWAESMKPVIEEGLKKLSDWVVNEFVPAMQQVWETLKNIWDWIVANKDWIVPVVVAIGSMVAAFMALNTVRAVVDNVKMGFQAFNLVLKANPIGLIIAAIAGLVAGLTWFFTKTETGQQIWQNLTDFFESHVMPVLKTVGEFFVTVWEDLLQPTFEAIGTFFVFVWENILQPAWTAVKIAFAILITGLLLYWEHVLKPMFEAIGIVFKWVWENILLPAWDALKLAWDVLVTALTWYWENILKPVFQALGTFFKWVWENVLRPVWDALKLAWDVLVTAISWVWENILKPVFQALGTFFNWVWNELLKPAFDALGTAWDALVDGIKWVWENILEPIFQALGDFINDTVVPLFEEGVEKIEEIWEGIKDFAKKPISFVINTVINDGLIPAFNTVAGWIPGVDKLSPVSVPGFAGGGWTGPGGKYEAAGVVHADEFVIRKESQRSIRSVAPGYLDALNLHGAAALDWGKGYADGGLVRPVRGGIVTSGFGASRGRYPHAGIDFAVPTGTPVYAAMPGAVARSGWNVVTGRTGIGLLLTHGGNRNTYYGHLSRAIVSAGDIVSKGQVIGLSGNTGRSTGPHLHWETWTGGKPVNPANVLAGAGLPVSAEGGEGGFDLLGPIRGIGEKISGWLQSEFPGGEFLADAAFGLAKKGFDDLIGWVGDKLNFFSDTGDDNFGGVTGIAGREVAKQNQRGAALPYLLRDKGGNLPTGLSLVLNNTGRDEAILNQRQWSDIHNLASGDRLSRDDLAELLDITIDNKIILDGKQVFNWVYDEAPRKYRAGV